MVKSGALVGTREPRPQGHVWRIHLPEHLTPSPDAAPASSPDGTLRRQDPSGALEGARAEALATHAATLIAPHLATIERLSSELQAKARRVGELEQQLQVARARLAELEATTTSTAAEKPRPWWARWWPWGRLRDA
jgi:uncharacterized membrane protein YccC